jgi:putative endopeptidase
MKLILLSYFARLALDSFKASLRISLWSAHWTLFIHKAFAPLLKAIKGVKDKKTLAAAVSALHQYSAWVLFDISSIQDAKDATLMIAGIDQNGLGMPDRDYYFEKSTKPEEEARLKIVDAYKTYIETILTLSGYKAANAKVAVEDIIKIETALAKGSLTRVERRDPEKTYNRVELKGVSELAPDLSWSSYFKALGQPTLTTISVSSKEYLKTVNQAMTDFTLTLFESA